MIDGIRAMVIVLGHPSYLTKRRGVIKKDRTLFIHHTCTLTWHKIDSQNCKVTPSDKLCKLDPIDEHLQSNEVDELKMKLNRFALTVTCYRNDMIITNNNDKKVIISKQ